LNEIICVIFAPAFAGINSGSLPAIEQACLPVGKKSRKFPETIAKRKHPQTVNNLVKLYNHRINHSKEEYSDCKGTHINGAEVFWSYAKRRLIRAKRHTSKRFLFTLERM